MTELRQAPEKQTPIVWYPRSPARPATKPQFHFARRHASMAIAVLLIAGGLSGCSQSTHRSEWLGASNGNLNSNDIHYALPRGIITVTAVNGDNGPTVSDPVQFLVPDRHARYAVRLDPSIIAYDKYDLKITNGLLSSSKSDNFDKSSEIAQTLVQIATEGLKISSARSALGRGSGARTAKWLKDAVVLDPFSGAVSAGCGLSPGKKSTAVGCLSGLQVTATDIDGGPLPVYSRDHLELLARRCESSLCSRMLRPVRVAVRLGGVVASEHIMMVPDPGMVVGHDVQRGACIQRVTTLTFTSGVLDRYELDKPSELSECLKIPLVVLTEIAKIPAALLTFRVEQIQKENKLLEVQKAQLDALMALAKAQADFASAAQGADARAAVANDARAAQLAAERAERQARRAAHEDVELEAARNKCDAEPSKFKACIRAYQACIRTRSHAECLQ